MRENFLHNFLVTGLLFASLGIIITLIAQKLRFFHFKAISPVSLKIQYPIWGFIGYLCVFFIATPLSLRFINFLLKEQMQLSFVMFMTLSQILSVIFVTLYLIFFSLIQKKETLKGIWIHPKRFHLQCLLEDFGIGVLTWIIAFPFIIFSSQFVEFITYIITGSTGIEQSAIRYLKMTLESPFALTIALFSIVIAAPFIEEFIFRGLLFSYFKQKFSFKRALLLSSLLFSLFHFSPSQGIGNFALLSSLFVLSLYLGFLYEKQASLIAPIALHMTFNSISVMRIILFSS